MARIFCYIILIQKELGIIFKILLLLPGRKAHFQLFLRQLPDLRAWLRRAIFEPRQLLRF